MRLLRSGRSPNECEPDGKIRRAPGMTWLDVSQPGRIAIRLGGRALNRAYDAIFRSAGIDAAERRSRSFRIRSGLILDLRVMVFPTVRRCLLSVAHAVVAIDFADTQPVVLEDRRSPLLLGEAMRTERPPLLHRFFIPPE